MAGMGPHLATGSVVWEAAASPGTRVDLAARVGSERVEEVSMRIREAMADRWPQADQVFLDVTNAPPRAGL
ncbi:hypothetical protein ACF08E_09565 [Streptomyces globisporus]|uniref:hypothetical protein n=1 Tax=Streptomyces globisporus TaxID=1908 RepID=UPI0036FA7931